jgi:hypothetical protein
VRTPSTLESVCSRLRMRTAGLVLVVACTACLLWPIQAIAADLNDYSRRVDEAIEVVEAVDSPELSVREALDVAIEVNTLLPSGETVTLDGDPIDVDQSVIRTFVARLDSGRTPENRASLVRELEAHLYSLRAALGDEGRTVGQDTQALQELLGARAKEPDTSLQEYFSKLIDRIIDWLQKWWKPGDSEAGTTSIGMIIEIVLAVALITLLGWVAILVWKWIRRSVSKRDSVADVPVGAVVAAAQDLPRDARGHAVSLAAIGDFRGAVRALFGGAARSLVDAGAIPQTRTRTNAELLADIADSRTVSSALAPLAELSGAFELAWYGHMEPDEAGWNAALECFDSVRRSLESGDAS